MIKMTSPNPVVVVPVHRPHPTPGEVFSLLRCGQVLGSHPICIVHPDGLNLEAYLDLLPTATPHPVPSVWMSSIRAYNRMMINPAFYRKLEQFTHALIHEPDALVLSDQLLYWCRNPYDYIGAPWFEGYSQATPEAPIIGVGNSGFSLINIEAVLRAFESNHRWISRHAVVNEFKRKLLHQPSCYSAKLLFSLLGPAGLLRGAHLSFNDNCDTFIASYMGGQKSFDFKIADVSAALRFSWEVNPAICAELCNQSSPFGIHAWAKYDRVFVEQLLSHYHATPS